MPLKRGRYKQYLWNKDAKIPKTTYYRNTHDGDQHQNFQKEFSPVTNLAKTSDENCQIEDFYESDSIETLVENAADEINNNSNDNLNLIDSLVNDNILYDNNESEDVFDENELNNLFSSNNINKEDLSAAYLTAFFNGRISQKSLKDFIMISNISSEIKMPSNFDGLAKVLIGTEYIYKYIKSWFCGVCLETFKEVDRFQRMCNKCNVKLNMSYYIDIEQQITKIFAEIDFNKFKTPTNSNSNSNTLFDITDGNVYQKLLLSEDGEFFKRKEAFSFLINTDGISICKKSKVTIWPFFLTINELPIESRFCLENLILAGF